MHKYDHSVCLCKLFYSTLKVKVYVKEVLNIDITILICLCTLVFTPMGDIIDIVEVLSIRSSDV